MGLGRTRHVGALYDAGLETTLIDARSGVCACGYGSAAAAEALRACLPNGWTGAERMERRRWRRRPVLHTCVCMYRADPAQLRCFSLVRHVCMVPSALLCGIAEV